VAASLERPGGNVTGIASFDPQQARKQFELLKRVSAFPLSAGHPGRCFAVMSSSPAMLIWSPKRSVFSAQRVHRLEATSPHLMISGAIAKGALCRQWAFRHHTQSQGAA
jgi:hypothetical protein